MLTYVAGGLVGLLCLGLAYEQVSRLRDRRYQPPGRLIDVGGYRLHMTDRGQGGPTVVVIHGAGDSSYSWTHVRNQVAAFTRVVTYDRAGLGSSDRGPAPSSDGSVTELNTLLTRAGIPGPYVLVGHSFGGLLARLYAIRYPEQVAGLVLVDSTHEFLKDDPKFRKGFAAIGSVLKLFGVLSQVGLPRFIGQVLKAIPMYPERPHYAQQLSTEEYEQWTANVYRNFRDEGGGKEFGAVFSVLDDAARQMKGAGDGPQFGDMPLVVLTNPGFGDGWLEMHRELASRSTQGIHRISDQKGHNLQMPRPDLVIDAIRHVVDQVGTATRQVE